MLTRRDFVQAAGIGAAGALTSMIGARGREHAVWSLLEPTLHAVEPGIICLASNENPVGPGKAVLDGLRAAGLADVPVVVGGIIPAADEAALRDAGVARVFTPKDFELTGIVDELVSVVREAAGLR